ncbi:MAG: GAF domain-containing protein, partial [Polyangiaceae bacterium]|nr:GAF domain-containing protein [Polyangiaceae bacterium]
GCEQTIRLAQGDGIAGSVIRNGQPVRVDDAYEDPRFSRDWDVITSYRTRCILAVPMRNHVGQTIGVLEVLNKTNGLPFTVGDESLLSELAGHAAISIDNVKLYFAVVDRNNELAQIRHSLERKVQFLHMLFELESAMARATDQQQLMQVVLSLTVARTRTTAGAAVLLSPSTPPHHAFVYRRDDPDRLGVFPIEQVVGTFAKSIQRRTAVSLHGIKRGTNPPAELQVIGLRARSVLAVPLLDGLLEPLGSLALYDREDEASFSDDDRELLQLVAANVSTAVSLLRSRESQQVSDRLSTIGSLLSGMLHDLKTPMAVISGYVQLMATTSSETERKDHMKLVLEQFEHITAMQREVLAFARGERTFLLSKIYLQKFFEEFEAQVRREIDGRGFAFEVDVRYRGTARFDKAKITRALHNLAHNAFDAMGSRGTLTVIVEREDNEIVMRVKDTGPGIPERVRSTLFESFVSAEKANGTGLGLAIVRKIAEEHGGSVGVTSSHAGAEFTLRIPQQ